ncbi:Hsp20/alpha crystallin family protein [Catenulispora subtropica]|uniref:Hsp20/alpha crystallin family protein n=1 Tax=Catenulispora subtropica TaxID=450798 RepID=A0ABN2RM64_9ACTN
MLMRTDPFRDLDRIASQLLGTTAAGTWSRPNPMPLDAWREDSEFVVCFDLPGVSLDAIDVDIERNVLTVKAERRPTAPGTAKTEISERPLGAFSRQLFLGDTLDSENVKADYDAGVLTLRIPIAEKAKPRKIEITAGSKKEISA